jgi:hypothetical protein
MMSAPIVGEHQLDDVGRRRIVDAERRWVDGFGGELLVFRTMRHRVSRNLSATKGRMLLSRFNSVNRP